MAIQSQTFAVSVILVCPSEHLWPLYWGSVSPPKNHVLTIRTEGPWSHISSARQSNLLYDACLPWLSWDAGAPGCACTAAVRSPAASQPPGAAPSLAAHPPSWPRMPPVQETLTHTQHWPRMPPVQDTLTHTAVGHVCHLCKTLTRTARHSSKAAHSEG